MKRDYILTSDLERLGKYYFQKGIDHAFNKEFSKAYEYLREGLDFLTCECDFYDLEKKRGVSFTEMFNDLEYTGSSHNDYLFTKALILSYSKEKKHMYLSLDAIERYSQSGEDQYSLFIKGRIYFKLEGASSAITYLEKANQISKSPRILYRIGRVKEQDLGLNGLNDLYSSFLSNPSSGCCAKELKKAFKEHKVGIKASSMVNTNMLIDEFLSDEAHSKFGVIYENFFQEQLTCIENPAVISSFLSFLKVNFQEFVETIDPKSQDLLEWRRGKNNSPRNNYETDRDIFDSPFYNDDLDMDQQSQEFWENM